MAEPSLSVALYDQRESEARILASYPALRAFSPVSFAQANFPIRVTDEIELRRYADIMHETISREEWLNTKVYSPEEAQAIRQLSTQIGDLTGRLFGKPVQPLMNLFPCIPLVRMVEHLAAAAGRRLTMVEIGPGSGHLAAYLLNLGHRLIAMDICQSLYLWQNRLFDFVSDGLDEWAAADVRTMPDNREPPAQTTHVPWWHFAHFHESLPVFADIVICDAAIGEMDHFAFRYIARIAKSMTARSDIGCFLFQNLGEQRVHQRAYVDQALAALGYRQHIVGGVTVLATSDRFPTRAISDLSEPPPWGAAGSMSSPAQFLPIDRTKLLESYSFFDFIDLGR